MGIHGKSRDEDTCEPTWQREEYATGREHQHCRESELVSEHRRSYNIHEELELQRRIPWSQEQAHADDPQVKRSPHERPQGERVPRPENEQGSEHKRPAACHEHQRPLEPKEEHQQERRLREQLEEAQFKHTISPRAQEYRTEYEFTCAKRHGSLSSINGWYV